MASYRDAIEWMAEMDDNDWLWTSPNLPSVTASMVSDIFNKPIEKVTKDMKKYIEEKDKQNHGNC